MSTPKHLAEPTTMTVIAENLAHAHLVWFGVKPKGDGRRRAS